MSVRSRSNLSAQMCAARHRIDQLACDANLSCRLAHRPLKDIAHAELASDLLYVDGLAFEGEARIARDDEQPFETRERGDDFLNHPIGKILLLGIAGHVLEGKHRNGRLVG